MNFKFASVFASVLALALVTIPTAAQACGDKDKGADNAPEATQSSTTVSDRFSA